jgi:uncharacterized membrane protein (UPF0127 family)
MKDQDLARHGVAGFRLRIVWIAKGSRRAPEGECPSIVPPVPARYVLEFAAGTAAAESLAAGDSVGPFRSPLR